MTQLKTPIKLPINWTSVLTYSGIGMFAAIFLGLLFKVRLLLVLAEVGLILILGGLAVAAFIAIVKKFTTTDKS